MKKIRNSYLIGLVLVSLVLPSCKKDKASDFKMNAQGPVGEVMVVRDRAFAGTLLTDSLVALFKTPYPGFPQQEPYFKVDTFPTDLFTGYAMRHRNVFQVKIGENKKNAIGKVDDAFAYNQSYMLLEATSDTAAIRLLNEYRDAILDYFETGEVKRYTKLMSGEKSTITDKIRDTFGFTLSTPEYGIKRAEDDFIWISKEGKRTTRAIMLYTFPYTDEAQLKKEFLVTKRDEVLKKYVQGQLDNTYLQTSGFVPVTEEAIDFNGYYANKLRGYWTLEGDFMGGPFIAIAFLDEPNDRIVMLDSYVFAPEAMFRPMDYLREIEGVFHTIQVLPKE